LALARAKKAVLRFRSTEFVSVLVAIIACFGATISALYSYSNRNRELDIELIKVGIGILRADPKETQTVGARTWAIEIIEKYSGHNFSIQARKELLKDKLEYFGYTAAEGWVPTWSYEGYTSDEKKPQITIQKKK
jgi:hypothetical protein